MEGYINPLITKPINLLTTLLLIITFMMASPISAAPAASKKASLKFIQISCNTTTYQSLCSKSLSPYASSIKTSSLKLCNTALAITIRAARTTSTTVSTLAKSKGITKIEAGAIRDCIENVQDTIDRLKQTITAMSSLSGPDAAFQMANAKTWASAAITDESTCLDGFSGRKVDPLVKNKIRTSILYLAQLSSNALALINHLNY